LCPAGGVEIQERSAVCASRIFKNLRFRNLGKESKRGFLRLVRQYSDVSVADFA
jgi:hypothetical protein